MASFIAPLLGLATGALGLGGQMSGSKQQQKLLQQQAAEQKQGFQNLQQLFQKWNQMTPAQVSQQLSQLTQPISANQATAVTNAVSPALANMGLAGSAGQLEANMAPQLAQYQGQNQQLAAQMLGLMSQLPAQIAGAEAGTPQNMGQFLQPPGQGGAASLFGTNLQTLLGKLSPSGSSSSATNIPGWLGTAGGSSGPYPFPIGPTVPSSDIAANLNIGFPVGGGG